MPHGGAGEPSHDAIKPVREPAGAKRRQSPGLSLGREHSDHKERFRASGAGPDVQEEAANIATRVVAHDILSPATLVHPCRSQLRILAGARVALIVVR